MEKFENPFYASELNEMFEKQRDKVLFKLKKEVKDENGKKWDLYIEGRLIGPQNYDIWHDDYIVSLHCNTSDCGYGYAINRVESTEKFKEKIFKAFGLTEPAQITLF